MPWLHLKKISELISLSMGSANIQTIVVDEPKRKFKLRPQIHVILEGNIGSAKSALLGEVAEKCNESKDERDHISVQTNLTFPSVVGTIDSQTKQIIPPVTWDIRNSTLLIDEFKWTGKGELIDAMLQMLESQVYTRRFGLFSVGKSDVDGDLFFKVSNGQIKIKTRFNMILATMRNLDTQRDIALRAMASRCLRYRFTLSKKELAKIACGEELIDLKKYAPKEHIEISRKTYMHILKIVKRSSVDESHFLRLIGDLCRLWAVTGRLNERQVELMMDMHRCKKISFNNGKSNKK